MDNQLAAQLLFQHGYATQEQILAVWTQVGPAQNIADVLFQAGTIREEVRNQLVAYLGSIASPSSQDAEPPMDSIASPSVDHSPGGSSRAPASSPSPAPGKYDRTPNPETEPSPTRLATSRSEAPTRQARASAVQPKMAAASTAEPADNAALASAADLANELLEPWLKQARQQGASDLHLCAGMPVHWRRHGKLEAVGDHPLRRDECEQAVRQALGDEAADEFFRRGDAEAVLEWPELGRIRLTAVQQRLGPDLTARLLPLRIPGFDELGLPETCLELTRWAQGLVLITGPAGCGKSTTLAALVNRVNQTRRDHILTIEDPIEILYPPGTCQVTQRQVGKHTKDRATALRAALREDPDILVISELRDLESIQLAVSAAETGHLVFGAMNTNNATRTIYRLVDSFPPEEQPIIRSMVSESLRGVLSQQLLPKRDGQGVVPAFEVLMVNSAVSNLIRKDETHQLGSAMITGKSSGMVLLDDSLRTLVEHGVVDPEEARKRAVQPKDFDRYFRGR